MTVVELILATLLMAAPQDVSLDLRDADLRDFFRLMAETSNINIVLHPAVQGRITLSVKNAPRDVLMDVVLKNYGLATEINGNVIRVVPLSVLENEYRQRLAIEQARLASLPLETRTIILNYAKAADVARIMSQFLSPRGSIAVDPRRNALIIRDIAR
jgi:type IV pilus assembly protein PilQ